MDEKSLRSFLNRLGIRPGRTNSHGWIPFSCPLATFTHQNGKDSRASAAARVAPEGISSFVCKGCHAHGRVAKLINLLATYRADDSIRPMMLEADRADAQAAITAGFGEFDRTIEMETIEPLEEAAYAGIYPSATTDREASAYLHHRDVEAWCADSIGLLWDDRQRRILFPVRDRNNALYGFSGRAIDADTQPKIRDYFGLPKRHLILGEHTWEEGLPLIVIEGLFGYAHLMQEVGINAAEVNIGALLGSAMTPEKAARIIALDEPTYLLLDPDQGGDIGLFGTITPEGGRERNGAIEQLMGHIPLFVPDWPEGVDDPDQLTREQVQRILTTTPIYGTAFDNEIAAWE